MKNLNRNTLKVNTYTERIIQFGEGNFLRAFANWMIHEMNKQANFDARVPHHPSAFTPSNSMVNL